MVVKKASDTCGAVFKFLFFSVFVFSLLLGIYLTINCKSISDDNTKIQYIDKWTVTDSSGKSFETGRTYNDDRAYTEDFTITSRLPKQINIDSVLCFMNRSNVKVYIGGELREDFDRFKDTGVPGGSLKEFYMTIPLSTSDAGDEVRIVRYKTDWNPLIVSETFITTYEGVYDYIVGKYGLAFGLSIVLLTASMLAIVVGIVLLVRKKQEIDMLYAAIGIFDVACWLLSVSQMTPFITRVYFVDGLMGFFFTMMMPFALLVYFNSIQKNRYRKCHSILFLISLINFVFFTILHFTGISSFQNSLFYIDSVLGIVIVSALITLIIDAVKGHLKEYPYTAAGILIFISSSIIEIVILNFFEVKSNEIPILIGLLFLLVFVVVSRSMISGGSDIILSRKSATRSLKKNRCSFISLKHLPERLMQRIHILTVIQAV